MTRERETHTKTESNRDIHTHTKTESNRDIHTHTEDIDRIKEEHHLSAHLQASQNILLKYSGGGSVFYASALA